MENMILTLEQQRLAPGPVQHEYRMKLESELDMNRYLARNPSFA